MKLKKLFKYNIAAASVTLALVILLSLFINPNVRLRSLRGAGEEAFQKVNGGTSVSLTLQSCALEAAGICAAAQTAGVDCTEATRAVSALQAVAESPYEAEAAADTLFREIATLFNTGLAISDAGDAVRKNAAEHYAKLGKLLKNLYESHAYNEAAAAYNTAVNRPISRLVGLRAFSDMADFSDFDDKYAEIYREEPSGTVSGLISSFVDWLRGLFDREENEAAEEKKEEDSFPWFWTVVIVLALIWLSKRKSGQRH